ncbi:MAG: ATP-binding protein [Desulfobacterales bacterium]|nr:ATP-binding protein [Desulfobacterales bacterium]
MFSKLPFLPKTIRSQVIMAFSACFLFMAIMIAVYYSNFHRLTGAMLFFALSGDINNTITEMRRYEKNYFLSREAFSYEENLTFTNRLAMMLSREKVNLIDAIGQNNYARFLKFVDEYSRLMEELRKNPWKEGCCIELQSQIRRMSEDLLLFADQLVSTERREVNHRLQRMIPLPMLNLGFLVFLMVFVIFFITEMIIRPLARITRESEQIAQGAHLRITPFGEPGNEIHRLVSAVNYMMGELENRQEQLVQSRKITAVGTLTSGIAHELNNPINNISLILESLIEDGENMTRPERVQLYEEAMGQTDRASETVKNLLEFSRASHPKMEKVDLEELVDKTVRLVSNELQLHHIKFSKETRGALPRTRVDRSGIQQVLLNLFINSIQAMPKGGVLKVITRLHDTLKEVRMDVEDTGEGIPADQLSNIFDPFFTTKKEGEGTGLGLSVSYSIIKKHAGRIEVKSTPGQGTCFSIFLPIEVKSGYR